MLLLSVQSLQKMLQKYETDCNSYAFLYLIFSQSIYSAVLSSLPSSLSPSLSSLILEGLFYFYLIFSI